MPPPGDLQRTTADAVARIRPRARRLAALLASPLPPAPEGWLRELTARLRGRLDDLGDELTRGAEEQGDGRPCVVLLGKPRSGKSTLLDALFPPQPGLQAAGRERVGAVGSIELRAVEIPAPGVALTEGHARAIDRADMLLLVVTDDGLSGQERELARDLLASGQRVLVVVNVKNPDLDLLLDAPWFIVRPGEAGAVAGALGLPTGAALAVHALAASHAGREPSAERRASLRRASQIEPVEEALRRFVEHEALAARSEAPARRLLDTLDEARDTLEEALAALEQRRRVAAEELAHAEASLRRAERFAEERQDSALEAFLRAEIGLPLLVDEIIIAGRTGSDLDARLGLALRQSGVEEALRAYEQEVCRFIERERQEQVASAKLDLKLGVDGGGLGEALQGARDRRAARRWRRAGRVAMQVVSGTAASALAGWAIANFWNPTGWLAAAGAGLAGLLAGGLARKEAARWAALDAARLGEERDQVADQAREALREARQQADRHLRAWSRQFFAQAREQISGPTRHLLDHIEQHERALVLLLSQLEQLRAPEAP